jgi:hypothetical protein
MYRKSKSTLVAAVLSMVVSGAALPADAQPYWERGLSPHSEELRHPQIVRAIRQLQATYRELDAAGDDFGGNKFQAMNDVQHAIHSLKRALFYRLHMDDKALDQLMTD